MANNEHADLLKDVNAWNAWRRNNPDVVPDLTRVNLAKADLHEANLGLANLQRANLDGANLSRGRLYAANLDGAFLRRADLGDAKLVGANLREADFTEANLAKADLHEANLGAATLVDANLAEADLSEASLCKANLSGANLCKSNLRSANLVGTELTNADLTGCRIYGISAWGLILEGAKQENLVITLDDEPEITVDNIEVAQFVYLLLHNEKIRDAIDTIGKKGVLILGRFTEGRIEILKRLRDELRKRDYLPLVFNFEKPETKDFTDTVRTLAGMARFIIADITAPRSTPLEAQVVVPDYMVPFVPIIEQGEQPFAMFKDLWVKYDKWVFEPISYSSVEELVQGLNEGIIEPALVRFDDLMKKRAEEMPVRRMADIINGAAHKS